MPGTTWPEGVIARYLTKAAEILGDDITVDVAETEAGYQARCRGCQYVSFDYTSEYAFSVVAERVLARPADLLASDCAQAHAEKCRAMPRPSDG
jgi:hypothetical protein